MFGLNEVLFLYSFYRWLKLNNSRVQKFMAKPHILFSGRVVFSSKFGAYLVKNFVLPKQRVSLGVLGVKVEPELSKSRTKKAPDNHEFQVMWKPLHWKSFYFVSLRTVYKSVTFYNQ